VAKKRAAREGTIYRRKDGRWTAQLTVGKKADGTPDRATYYGKTQREVQDKLSEARAEMQKGAFVRPSDITVGEWLVEWLNDYKKSKLQPSTWASYEIQVRCHIVPEIGQIKLQELRPDHIQRVYNKKLKEGLSPRSVRYIHQVLHGALKQAMKNNYVYRNVSEATDLPPLEPIPIHPLSQDEIQRLMDAISGSPVSLPFSISVTGGIRRGELLGQTWSALDLDNGIWRVEQQLVRIRNEDPEATTKTRLVLKDPKTKTSVREVTLPDEIVEKLRQHKEEQEQQKRLLGPAYHDHDLVFCAGNGNPIDPRNFVKRFERALKMAALPHHRFHDLRHSFATFLLERGVNPKVVADLLGHKKVSTTLDMYSHVSRDVKREATSGLHAMLWKDRACPDAVAQ
jgi:integrase